MTHSMWNAADGSLIWDEPVAVAGEEGSLKSLVLQNGGVVTLIDGGIVHRRVRFCCIRVSLRVESCRQSVWKCVQTAQAGSNGVGVLQRKLDWKC